MNNNFNKIYESSIKNPEDFWQEIADDIFWFKKPNKILNKSKAPFYKWFEDGVTNTCYNALDIHVDQGRGDKTCLIYDSPITGSKKQFTYKELKNKVSKFAGALTNQGINKGDRVIIYMPMIPEAVIAMLACGRIGAIHSVVFGGFASNELASRIDDSKAKILITASCGFEPGKTVEYKPLVDEALKLASHKIDKIILFQRSGHEVKLNAPKELSWDEVLSNAQNVDCVEMNSNEFAYILYTSGTTGDPKGAMLTHNNFTSNVRAGLKVISVTHEDTLLSFLPLSHVFERVVGYYLAIYCGAEIAYAESPFAVANNMKEVRPTVMASVPRLYEMMHDKILKGV